MHARARRPAGASSTAKSGTFVLPLALGELIDAGMELGAADDKVPFHAVPCSAVRYGAMQCSAP